MVPGKITDLAVRPLVVVEVDFSGQFPNGQYALVLRDHCFRYPEVEFANSTSFERTREKLKKIISTHGVRQTLQTDNGQWTTTLQLSCILRIC